MVAQQEVTFDSAILRMKKLVYKNRIRLSEFIRDFDKLNKGEVHPSHFTRAMAMAGVDKHLSAAEIAAICEHYTVPKTASSTVMEYKKLLAEVDSIFTKPNLENSPLECVPSEPSDLLDRERYQRSSRQLDDDKEAKLQLITERLAELCSKRGVMFKSFFDDCAKGEHSAKVYGHVTVPQFKQCLSVKACIRLSEEECAILVEKYFHDDFPELVNYIALSHIVDPPLCEPVA